MKKVTVIIVLGVLIAASTLTFFTIRNLSIKEEIYSQLKRLPNPPFVDLDSGLFKIPAGKNVILIYFNPDCIHCHEEATQIKKGLHLLKDTKIVFFSDDLITNIRSFGLRQNMVDHSGVSFAKIPPQLLFKNFGTLGVPHIFIYGADGKLKKQFKGKTSMERILKAVDQ